MPTTRRQQAIAEGKIEGKNHGSGNGAGKRAKGSTQRHPSTKAEKIGEPKGALAAHSAEESATATTADVSEKRKADKSNEEPPEKRPKTEEATVEDEEEDDDDDDGKRSNLYKSGTIERGHVYFFYRPRVEVEEVKGLDDVSNFHMLLVPRPPEYAVMSDGKVTDGQKKEESDDKENMKLLHPGADAIPAPALHSAKQHYRLITVGKKKLADPDKSGAKGGRTKENFWATVTAVGDDLSALEPGFEAQEYETKTRGTRHKGAVRVAGRGAYVVVNADTNVPSKKTTHFGYCISDPQDLGDVQDQLGIKKASSFHVQVKNPKAPASGPQNLSAKNAEYPEWIMKDVFGAAIGDPKQTRGRESYGLRFTSVETPELLDYEHAQLLFIASRSGVEGLNESLGENRGEALEEEAGSEGHNAKEILAELALDAEKFPVKPLTGEWI